MYFCFFVYNNNYRSTSASACIMKALKCITLGINRAIGMMTDSTVVRIEALYGTGNLEFTTLVVHTTLKVW